MSKVKELLKDADICFLGYERNGCRDLIQMGLEKLHEAQKELSKSDWVSVEDGLPPYCENVQVIAGNNNVMTYITCRVRNHKDNELDKNGFIKQFPYMNINITHWKPIEKLEE